MTDERAVERLTGVLSALEEENDRAPYMTMSGVRLEVARLFDFDPEDHETADALLSALTEGAVDGAHKTVLSPPALCLLQGLRVGEKLGYARGMEAVIS